MECPYCLSTRLKVTDKRDSPKGIRRRRECLKCGKRFTTYETILKTTLYVIKKNGQKEKFEIEKLKNGIMKAFKKRPVKEKDIEKMIQKIVKRLNKQKNKEIKSSKIGEIVINQIKKMDDVAYLRFASVYRDFKDVKDFKKELKVLT